MHLSRLTTNFFHTALFNRGHWVKPEVIGTIDHNHTANIKPEVIGTIDRNHTANIEPVAI